MLDPVKKKVKQPLTDTVDSFLYVCQRFCIELVSENYTYVDSISKRGLNFEAVRDEDFFFKFYFII